MKNLNSNYIYNFDYNLIQSLKTKSDDILMDIIKDKVLIKVNEYKQRAAIRYKLDNFHKDSKFLIEEYNNIKPTLCGYVIDDWNNDFKKICKKELSFFELVSILNKNAKEYTYKKFLKFASSKYGNQIERKNIYELIKNNYLSYIFTININYNEFDLSINEIESQFYLCEEKFYSHYFNYTRTPAIYDISNNYKSYIHTNPLIDPNCKSASFFILMNRGYFNYDIVSKYLSKHDTEEDRFSVKSKDLDLIVKIPLNYNKKAVLLIFLGSLTLWSKYFIYPINFYFSTIYNSIKNIIYTITNNTQFITLKKIDYNSVNQIKFFNIIDKYIIPNYNSLTLNQYLRFDGETNTYYILSNLSILLSILLIPFIYYNYKGKIYYFGKFRKLIINFTPLYFIYYLQHVVNYYTFKEKIKFYIIIFLPMLMYISSIITVDISNFINNNYTINTSMLSITKGISIFTIIMFSICNFIFYSYYRVKR